MEYMMNEKTEEEKRREIKERIEYLMNEKQVKKNVRKRKKKMKRMEQEKRKNEKQVKKENVKKKKMKNGTFHEWKIAEKIEGEEKSYWTVDEWK